MGNFSPNADLLWESEPRITKAWESFLREAEKVCQLKKIKKKNKKNIITEYLKGFLSKAVKALASDKRSFSIICEDFFSIMREIPQEVPSDKVL